MNLAYILYRPHEWWYYLKCLVWYKYNRVKIKTLSPTWNDRDDLLIHAMFQILSDFVNKEKPDEAIDWDITPERRLARDKMNELLDWWNNVYLMETKPRLIHEELTQKLIELIQIRKYLWT